MYSKHLHYAHNRQNKKIKNTEKKRRKKAEKNETLTYLLCQGDQRTAHKVTQQQLVAVEGGGKREEREEGWQEGLNSTADVFILICPLWSVSVYPCVCVFNSLN